LIGAEHAPRGPHVLLLFCLWLGLSAACPAVPAQLERPLITVREIAATGISDGQALLVRVDLSVYNPNLATMHARALDWQLSLAGQQPVRGRSSFDATMAGKNSANVSLQFELLPKTARPALHEGGQAFHFQGTVHVFNKRGDMGVTFDRQGRLAPW
jgi:hypothetical protein